ncbi:TetR/AcrR family transcriptional regulator [Streptomyces sp. NPDC092296]|uniref:TetR/AcrR family transcriptional regulator n=1 Tax=Streptomyces sp. NPDC092296 TaxID=3366012 RepID=UPI003826933E
MADEGPQERADAARNRIRLLEAASRLVAEHGAEHVTMEAVAAAASVGKGTVFRRFGDRVGLMLALLDHAEREHQAAFLTGPAPLGPGAPPVERLEAFGVATLRHQVRYLDLFLAADQCSSRRFTAPPRLVRAAHITTLLREAGVGGDVDLLTEALLGFLDTALISHLCKQRGLPVERLEAGWRDLVGRLVR